MGSAERCGERASLSDRKSERQRNVSVKAPRANRLRGEITGHHEWAAVRASDDTRDQAISRACDQHGWINYFGDESCDIPDKPSRNIRADDHLAEWVQPRADHQ